MQQRQSMESHIISFYHDNSRADTSRLITNSFLRLDPHLAFVLVLCAILVMGFLLPSVVPDIQAAEVTLSWDDPDNGPAEVDTYTVYYWQPNWEIPASESAGLNLSHTLSSLEAGQPYEFAVTAGDPNGTQESTYSNIVMATLPAANFSSEADANDPLTIIFTDGSSGTLTNWAWDFSDGNTSTEQNPSHTYSTDGTYTVTLMVTGPEGSDSTTSSITITNDTSVTEIHAADLDGSSINNGSTWTAVVTITVHDTADRVTSEAEVNGTWSGGYVGSGVCMTDSNGQCSLESGDIRKREKSVTFTIDNVTHSILMYQPADNHDDDGDSDGKSIKIDKP